LKFCEFAGPGPTTADATVQWGVLEQTIDTVVANGGVRVSEFGSDAAWIPNRLKNCGYSAGLLVQAGTSFFEIGALDPAVPAQIFVSEQQMINLAEYILSKYSPELCALSVVSLGTPEFVHDRSGVAITR
jgi:hypothetical protein